MTGAFVMYSRLFMLLPNDWRQIHESGSIRGVMHGPRLIVDPI